VTSCTEGPWYECRQCSYSTNKPAHADQHEADTGHIVVEISHADWENW